MEDQFGGGFSDISAGPNRSRTPYAHVPYALTKTTTQKKLDIKVCFGAELQRCNEQLGFPKGWIASLGHQNHRSVRIQPLMKAKICKMGQMKA